MTQDWSRYLKKSPFWLWTAIVGAVSFLYYPVLLGLADDWWNDPDYSHGLLVPFISLYFIWDKKDRLKQLSFRADYRGLLVLLSGVSILTLGNAGSELFLMRISLLITISGLIIGFLGFETLKTILFPVGFLFFMIPLPAIVFNAVAFPLQLFAAQTAAFCLQVVRIPVLREGNLIYLASSIMDVTEACSGIRSLMTLSALGTLFAYITQKTTLKRGLMMASTIPIAIFSNAFRVTGTGLLAQFVGEEAARGFYHTFTGWLVFIVAFILLLLVGFILSKFPDKKPVAARPFPSTTSSAKFRPIGAALTASILILGVGIYLNNHVLLHGQPVLLEQSLSGMPHQIEEWTGNDHPFEEKTVKVLGVTDYINRLYVAETDAPEASPSLWLYAGYYASQRTGATYHSPKNCLPGSGWEIVELEQLPVPMVVADGGQENRPINKVIVQKGLERQLILYWYQDRGRIITSEYWAKIYLIWDSITKGRTDGAMIRVSVPIPKGGSPEEALATGVQYIHQISPYLLKYLPGPETV
ncbi:MAG: VPLPA-CTERM-specific exosortase XrtD [Nitrospiria bacterium]